MKAMTYRELKDKIAALTDEQMDMPVRWWGADRGGEVQSLDVLAEEHICVDGEIIMEPRSVYQAQIDSGDLDEREITARLAEGTPILQTDLEDAPATEPRRHPWHDDKNPACGYGWRGPDDVPMDCECPEPVYPVAVVSPSSARPVTVGRSVTTHPVVTTMDAVVLAGTEPALVCLDCGHAAAMHSLERKGCFACTCAWTPEDSNG